MSSNGHIDVLGLGSVTVDLVGTVENWPLEGRKKLLQSFSICDGGLVGTALVAVSRLGGKASFAGKLGGSEMAKRAVDALHKEGIDTSFLLRTENAEPIIAFVITNIRTGQRNIFWTRHGVTYPFPTEFPDQQWFRKTAVLLIDFESGRAGIEAAKIARLHSVPVVVDVEQNEPYVAEAMASSAHVVVSEDFAAPYTGKKNISDMLLTLQSSPDQTIIITRGEKGCAGLSADGMFELPAFKVEVADTTGCGDVFHGAYALAVARGKAALDAARFASAAASLCATKLGGRAGTPTMDELNSFIENQY